MVLSDHDLRQIDQDELQSLPPEKMIEVSLRLLTDLKEARGPWLHQRCSIKSQLVWRQFIGHLCLSPISYRSPFNMAQERCPIEGMHFNPLPVAVH